MTSSSGPNDAETDALTRSQQAIDEGNGAARHALGDQFSADDPDDPVIEDGPEPDENEV